MDYQEIKIGGGDTTEPLNVAKRLSIIRKVITSGKILDCGCGAGEYIPALTGLGNVEIAGIEFDEEKVRKFKGHHPADARVIQGNIQQMPYQDAEFDLVILNEVLEHIPDQDKGLDEINRVLKRTGKLIVFSPNRFYPFETHGVYLKNSARLVPKAFPFIPYIPLSVGNMLFNYRARNYFPMELRNLLKRHRFRIKKQTYITQTFEGIGGVQFLRPLRSVLRLVVGLIERVPLVRIPFCVSQVLIVEKTGVPS